MKSSTKREKAAVTVAAIRARYPNPVARPSLVNNQYCVVFAAEQYDRKIFARIGFVARRKAIRVNDLGDFEAAWKIVEDALAA